jgi:hypothetical protein
LDLDLSGAVLVSGIIFRDGAHRALFFANQSLSNDWDTPIEGSDVCTTMHGERPSDRFGHVKLFGMDSVCSIGLLGEPGILIYPGASNTDAPYIRTGCISNNPGPPETYPGDGGMPDGP